MNNNLSYTMNTRVTHSAIGEDGNMRLGALIDLLQDCSGFHFDGLTELLKFFSERNLSIFLAARQVDIYRLPKLGEPVSVKSWVYDYNRSVALRNTVLFDERGSPIVASNAIGALVDLSTRRGCALPDSAPEIGVLPKFEMDCKPRRINVDFSVCEALPPSPVLRAHIDYNRHVNNARYIDAACEYLPAGFGVARVRVEFKNAARAGDTFFPYRQTERGRVVVALCAADRSPYAVVEFS